MQGGGMIGSIFGSSAYNESQQRIAQLQMEQNNVRKQAMEVNARRQQTENLRNTQLQRSMAINSATAQGAQFGTGLQGGIAQVNNTGMWNNLGINQSLMSGRQMFALDDQINIQKQNAANAQTQMSMFQGMSSFGASLTGAAGTFGKMAQGFGSTNYGPSYQTYGEAINMQGRGPLY